MKKRMYKTNRKYPCPYCDLKMYRDDLIHHVEDKHSSMLPEGYSAVRAVYDHINKKNYGTCMVCGDRVYEWDPNISRYKNICNKPSCINAVRAKALKNNLSDPKKQMEMLSHRKIAGTYEFSDGVVHSYVGSYEKKCLEFMDKVLEITGNELLTPGPVIEYEYEGQKHTWILDIYYLPANLAIDCKDGGDNPNNRDMKSYREKQLAKEAAIMKENRYNYLRLTDNDFSQLLTALADIKLGVIEQDPDKGIYIHEGVPGGMPPSHIHNYYIIPYGMSGMNADDVEGFTFGNTALDTAVKFDRTGNFLGFDPLVDKLMKDENTTKIFFKNRDETLLEGIDVKDGKVILERLLGHPYYCFADFLFCEDAYVLRDMKGQLEQIVENTISEAFMAEMEEM